MQADVFSQQLNAFRRIEINYLYTQRPQPVQPALKISAFAHHYRAEPELPHQSAAIPARRQCGYHGQTPVTALTAGVAKGVRLAMKGGVAILYAAVVAGPHQLALRVKDCRADRNSAFRESRARF